MTCKNQIRTTVVLKCSSRPPNSLSLGHWTDPQKRNKNHHTESRERSKTTTPFPPLFFLSPTIVAIDWLPSIYICAISKTLWEHPQPFSVMEYDHSPHTFYPLFGWDFHTLEVFNANMPLSTTTIQSFLCFFICFSSFPCVSLIFLSACFLLCCSHGVSFLIRLIYWISSRCDNRVKRAVKAAKGDNIILWWSNNYRVW